CVAEPADARMEVEGRANKDDAGHGLHPKRRNHAGEGAAERVTHQHWRRAGRPRCGAHRGRQAFTDIAIEAGAPARGRLPPQHEGSEAPHSRMADGTRLGRDVADVRLLDRRRDDEEGRAAARALVPAQAPALALGDYPIRPFARSEPARAERLALKAA